MFFGGIMITHLFFDIGSTLVDETACVEKRLIEALKQPGAPTREVFEQKLAEFILKSGEPVKAAAAYFGLSVPPWDSSLEKVFPEAYGVLEALAKKYALGVIANQSLGGEKRLKERGLRKFFGTVTLSAETGFSKPDPKIFFAALNAAGCRPENAVMIGDRFDNDILPAGRLGFKTVWIRRGMFKNLDSSDFGAKPDHTVSSLEELLEIF